MDVIIAMAVESGIDLKELRVDGGPSRDDFLMQFQSDMLNVPVIRNKIEELSATGAMYMGGLAMGIWGSLEELEELRETEHTFLPAKNVEWRNKNYKGWKEAVDNLLSGMETKYEDN